jgi:hypothetical protein
MYQNNANVWPLELEVTRVHRGFNNSFCPLKSQDRHPALLGRRPKLGFHALNNKQLVDANKEGRASFYTIRTSSLTDVELK